MIVLKIILWVILSVLLLLLVALLIPVRVCVEYKSEAKVVLKFLFIKFTLIPQKQKKKKKRNKKGKSGDVKKKVSSKAEDDSQTGKFIKDLYKAKGIDGFVSLISELAKLAAGSLKGMFKHILFKKFDVNIKVSADNAADTAIKYGYICAGVYPAVSLVLNTVKYKSYSVNIAPDFDEKESVTEFEMQANILLLFAVIEALKILFGFVNLKKNDIL